MHHDKIEIKLSLKSISGIYHYPSWLDFCTLQLVFSRVSIMIRLVNISILIFLLLFLSQCSQSGNEAEKNNHLREVKVAELRTTDISIPRGFICDIYAFQYVEIHARVQGYLEDIYVDEGQTVKKNAPLFRISANEYREMVSRAEANLQRAIAEAKTKSLEYDRIKLMVDKNIISSTELEVSEAKKQAAESAIKEAESILENAKINLRYTYIHAPFDGIIDRIPFKIGSLINSGTLLTSISNVDNVYAYFRVSEADYLRFIGREIENAKSGMNKYKVSLLLADESVYPYEGHIETMEGDIDRETGTIAFRARFPNPEGILKHGGTGKIVMQRKLEDIILIPQQSTFAIQDKNYVFVMDKKNVVRAKSFHPIDRYKKYFVASDLLEGDRIVLEGVQQIKDGAQIRPVYVTSDSLRISKL